MGRAWQHKMGRMQGRSYPQGVSSISQFQHKSTHISCSRKVNSITRSTFLCSRASRTAARQPRLEKPQFKTLFCTSQLRKTGIFLLSKTEQYLFCFQLRWNRQRCNHLVKSRLAFRRETGISSVQHFIKVWFYIKGEQASRQALLAYRKVHSLKAGYCLSLNITNTLWALQSLISFLWVHTCTTHVLPSTSFEMKVIASKDTKKKKERELLYEKQKSPLTFEIRQILATR